MLTLALVAGAATAQPPASKFIQRSDGPRPEVQAPGVPAQQKFVPRSDAAPATPLANSSFVPRAQTPRAGLAAPVMPTPGEVIVAQDKKDGPLPAAPIGARPGQDPFEAYIRLEPPGKERLFGTRDTEKELEERMRQERRDAGSSDPIAFPATPQLGDDTQATRQFAPSVCLAEPNYVVYRRLYFEEKNSERYGWELGPMQPAASTLAFFRDFIMWPHNIVTQPHRRFETSAGQCWPGDPVPFRSYPPELTGSGLLAEVSLIWFLFWAIP